MRGFIKRLFCTHYWLNPGTDISWLAFTGKVMRVCKKCGKKKLFRYEPVNPIEY